MSPPTGRPKEGSLPLGGKACSAKGAHHSPPTGRPKEGSLPLGGKACSAKGAQQNSARGSPTGIALFDLDHTLLAGDATYEWIHFLIDLGVLDRGSCEAELERYYDDYRAGTLDIHAFLHFDFRPLASHSRVQLEQWRKQYLAKAIVPIILPGARDLIAQHKVRGHLTAIITAANSFVATPIAAMFDVDDLVASVPECHDGEFTGKIDGIPCFHAGKVIKLDAWLESRGQLLTDFGESYYYGDSQSDVPLMEKVTHPVAVQPDGVLAALARARHWPIISLC